MENKKRYLLFLVLLAWAVLLFFFALQPKALVLFFLKKAAVFKTAHLMAYGLLAYLSCAWCHVLWPYWKRATALSLFSAIAGGFILTFICAASTEYVQIYSVDRIPDIKDFKIDLIGASYGLSVFFLSRIGRVILGHRQTPGRALQLDLFSEL